MPRKKYSLSFKRKIIQLCREKTFGVVAKENWLDERMIRRWVHTVEIANSLNLEGDKFRLAGAGRKPILGDLKDIA